MAELIDAIELQSGVGIDAAALARMCTGSIAGKERFIAESLLLREVLVARAGGRIAGTAIWDRRFFGRPFVWLLGVDPAFRRRGIAARLLGEVATRCTGEPLFTSTNTSNRAMRRMLDQLGFVASGCVDNLDPDDPELFYYRAAACKAAPVG